MVWEKVVVRYTRYQTVAKKLRTTTPQRCVIISPKRDSAKRCLGVFVDLFSERGKRT